MDKKHKIQNKISLPVKKKTPSCICMEASYTAEVVVVIPLFVAFMVVLLFFFRVLQVQQEVGCALQETAKEMAIYAYAENTLSPDSIIEAKLLFLRKCKGGKAEEYVDGGKMGISLLNSELAGEYVDLKAEYAFSLPVGFFGMQKIFICQRAKCRKWTGRLAAGGGEDTFVYVTPNGEVYHRNKNCRYLDLSVHQVWSRQIFGLRNKNGEKYYACEKCMQSSEVYDRVYITDYGNRYHGKPDCRELKRTIIAVRISETGILRPCSRCGKENL